MLPNVGWLGYLDCEECRGNGTVLRQTIDLEGYEVPVWVQCPPCHERAMKVLFEALEPALVCRRYYENGT